MSRCSSSENIFFIDDCKVNPMEHSFEFFGFKKQVIQPKVIEVLTYLAVNYPKLISREELINEVWAGNVFVGEKALTNAIWRLRQNFKRAEHDNKIIETIRKTGYRLLVEPRYVPLERNSEQQAQTKTSISALRLFFLQLICTVGGLVFIFFVYSILSREGYQFLKPIITSITTDPGIEVFPSLSPDGRYMVFKWKPLGQTADLYLKDLQKPKKNYKRLTHDASIEGSSVWDAQSKHLYFPKKDTESKTCNIVKLEIATSKKTDIAKCPFIGFTQIVLSPDGKTLAYYGQEYDPELPEIYLLNITRSNTKPKRLSCLLECNYREVISCSPLNNSNVEIGQTAIYHF